MYKQCTPTPTNFSDTVTTTKRYERAKIIYPTKKATICYFKIAEMKTDQYQTTQRRTQELTEGVLHRRGATEAGPGICVMGQSPPLPSSTYSLPPTPFPYLPLRSRAPFNQLEGLGSASSPIRVRVEAAAENKLCALQSCQKATGGNCFPYFEVDVEVEGLTECCTCWLLRGYSDIPITPFPAYVLIHRHVWVLYIVEQKGSTLDTRLWREFTDGLRPQNL